MAPGSKAWHFSWESGWRFFDASPESSSPAMAGEVRTRWGIDRAWIESDFVAEGPAGPRYAVHIVVAGNRTTGESMAFAVNTLSPLPIVYEGRLFGPDLVTFLGSAAGKWQKVTYRLLAPERLDFLVEQAAAPDGPWSLHSHATLTRKPSRR